MNDKSAQKMKDETGRRATITVAIAGNPNAGKTTLFNGLTGSRQHVGNWPGVTVEKKQGSLEFVGRTINVVDLPGTYSLTAYSMEEVIARDFITNEKPDVVVNIIDASNLERNLYVTTQLLELGAPLIIALNMVDVAESRGLKIDTECLGALLGAPVVPMVARTGAGKNELLKRISNPPAPTIVRVRYARDVEAALSKLTEEITRQLKPETYPAGAAYAAVKLLENDAAVQKQIESAGGARVIELRDRLAARIEETTGDDPETLIVDSRYGYISGLMREVMTRPAIDRRTTTDNIDAVLTHRALGLPFFVIAMWATFQITFRLGAAPMQWLDALFGFLAGAAHSLLGDTIAGSLVVDGVIGGVGGVLSFLPNILLLFMAISLLEDTGYMARAAFIMDKVMHKLHLHGKSFIPMLVGFGCSVPAIMATRTLENNKDRIVTILVTPLMSCGARLPVYVLLAGAFFPSGMAGNVIFSIYLIGILFAIFLARLFRTRLLKGDTTPFVMELPPYRMPTLKSVLLHMWERAWFYFTKAGTVILGFSLMMWFLMSFPRDYAGRGELRMKLQTATTESARARAESELAASDISHSFAGRAGKFIEPALKPIGFDWKMGIAIISGLSAKEVIVSTLGTVYSIGHGTHSSRALKQAIRRDPAFRPLTAYALMLFVLLMMPCMSTVAMIKKETGSWRWPAFSLTYHTLLAWIVCFLVYQGGRLVGL